MRPGAHVPEGMTTFIVRVARDESGELQGIVERVATGLKQRFRGAAEDQPDHPRRRCEGKEAMRPRGVAS